MFKKIISRDNGTPWGETDMTSQKWLEVPLFQVRISDLIATQPGVLLHALALDYADPPIGGDVFPHVVMWQDEFYLEDGHHRVMRRIVKGKKKVWVRVLTVPHRVAKMRTQSRDFCRLPDCYCDGLTSHP